jgi:hypothetical protein
MRFITTLAALFALGLGSAQAATTITFGPGLAASYDKYYLGDSVNYTESGFVFTALGGRLASYTQNWADNANPGGAVLIELYPGWDQLHAVDGSAFSLKSIDFAAIQTAAGAANQFKYSDSTGVHTGSLNWAADPYKPGTRFHTHHFNLNNITSFSVSSGGFYGTLHSEAGWQLDNVVLTPSAAVPEPAAAALLLMGLGLVTRRATRRQA